MALRVITEEELNPPDIDEADVALSYLLNLMADYKDKKKSAPTKVYISDNEELQSWIMYAANSLGLRFERTSKAKTYLV